MFSLGQPSQLPEHYEVQTLLGEGAFSSVYKGLNTKTGETVAIKIINKLNLNLKQLANISNEVHLMNTLTNSGSHTNILRLIESFDTEENCYLVLEYCDGGEIFNKIIEYTYFSEDLARHVFVQLLDAVLFMHLKNVVHRDIKPENLLFKSIPFTERSKASYRASLRSSDDDSKKDEGKFIPGIGGGSIGTIKLADFGLAKQLKYDPLATAGSSKSNLKTPCGTAGYTAPEVIHCGVDRKRRFKSSASKSNFYSKAVDIWSLGCFLYTSLCGFPPFYDEDNEVLTHKILTADFVFLEPWWDEISADAKDLILKMLVVNAKARITIDEIYEHPWMANCVPLKTDSYFPEHTLSKSFGEMSLDVAPPQKIGSPAPMTGGLASPKIAIKQVFNNPAMSHVNLKSLAQLRKDKQTEYLDPREVKFDLDGSHGSGSSIHLPRTPNPMNKVNFKNVFGRKSLGGDSDEDESDEYFDDSDLYDDSDADSLDDSEEIDDVLEFHNDLPSGGHFRVEDEMASTHRNLKNHLISSTSSMDSLKLANNDEEYVTRSSSVISGVTGDYKFTLNMNDLNLLGRRSSMKSRT